MTAPIRRPADYWQAAFSVCLLLVFLGATGAMIYGVITMTGWPVVWVLLGYAAFLWIFMFLVWIMVIAFGDMGMMG